MSVFARALCRYGCAALTFLCCVRFVLLIVVSFAGVPGVTEIAYRIYWRVCAVCVASFYACRCPASSVTVSISPSFLLFRCEYRVEKVGRTLIRVSGGRSGERPKKTLDCSAGLSLAILNQVVKQQDK